MFIQKLLQNLGDETVLLAHDHQSFQQKIHLSLVDNSIR